MNARAYTSLLALVVGATTLSIAQAATPAAAKPIVKTTCQDYLALDETIKPKFIYFAEGHSKKGKPEAVFDMVATEKIQPALDEYCKVNLTKSAYARVMQTSMASEKAEHKAGAKVAHKSAGKAAKKTAEPADAKASAASK